MANIDTYLQQILAAIYGEDVRGSIHDAIEAINDQVDAAEETMEQFVQGAMDTTLTSTTKPAEGKAVGSAVNGINGALKHIGKSVNSEAFCLPLSWINSSGEIVASSQSSGQYAYDLMCYQVDKQILIDSINANYPFIYGFFSSRPAIGSVTYNQGRTSSGSATTLANITVPNGCTWIAVRAQHDDGQISINQKSYYDFFSMIMRGSISSGNMDNCIEPGMYVHTAGSSVENAPDTGGVLFVGKHSATVVHVYITTRSSNEGKIYTRYIVNGTASNWILFSENSISMVMRGSISSGNMDNCIEPGMYVHTAGSSVENAPDTGGVLFVGKHSATVVHVYITTRSSNEGKIYTRYIVNGTASNWILFESAKKRSDVKIAFFGDSIIWGSIKTLSNGSFVTTQANPTIPQTMSNRLNCDVSNYAVGGMGYITKAGGQNILEKVEATNLTGYTHALFSAGDNDSSAGSSGIGSYTDTGTDTIMGQCYNIIKYLHDNYPRIKPVFICKNNKVFTTADGINRTYFGSFPKYYYGFTYGNGFSISALNDELKKFCEYYHIGYISQNEFSGGYNLLSLIGEDGTHFSQIGYNETGLYMAAQLTKYI